MSPNPKKTTLYRHFILSVWEERDAHGQHVTWRFALQESHKEVRIGFKTLAELTAFLEQWIKSSSANQIIEEK